MKQRALDCLVVLLAVIWLAGVAFTAQPAGPEELTEEGNQLYENKNYKEAYQKYEKAVKAGAPPEQYAHLFGRIMASKLRLRLFDSALESAETYVEKTKGTWRQARAERLAGNLYLRVPHWGTRAGGEFHRAQHKQGIRLRSWNYDKRHAVSHLEKARRIYTKYDHSAGNTLVMPAEDRKGWHEERINCLFDLTSAVTRFGIYSHQWYFWYRWWGERDEFRAQTAGEEDFDEYYSHYHQRRKRPTGLRVGPDGEPIFPSKPKKYSGDLTDDQKMLFLLDRIRHLDRTENGKFTALSYYRQAMLARSRFGMDRLNRCAGLYHHNGKQPLKQELKDYNPWELKDDETLTLVGGHVRRITLPDRFNVLRLLRKVENDYTRSGYAAQSKYAAGFYYQSRQQYNAAIAEYDGVHTKFADRNWAGKAASQVRQIKAHEVKLSRMGVQLPGRPAKVQITHRNLDKVWFVARRIDIEGFLRELRNRINEKRKHHYHHYALRRWDRYFMRREDDHDDWDYWIHKMSAKYTGKVVARWATEVEDDGSHRAAHATIQTPIKDRGGYLVYCYREKPPKEHEQVTGQKLLTLGASRAVMVLTDLAIVQKNTDRGKLYYISGADGGAPVKDADVRILETWRKRVDKKDGGHKYVYKKKMHQATTGERGLILFGQKEPDDAERILPPEEDQARQQEIVTPARDSDNYRHRVHLLVSAGEGRLAWTGMRYYNRYSPSRMRRGRWAYVITDRPVYRPEQTVRFKLWLRTGRNGVFENADIRSVSIAVRDPKGNRIHSEAGTTDRFGGYEGSFTLEEEPMLGVYRIKVHGRNYVGGQNFRVEEYKKPEFEVSVEPSTTHAKLGQTVKAKIKANYYFGKPVTKGTVKYRVFREEYRHRSYPGGYWDWLYGPGYGYVWYDYDWFPWWRHHRRSYVAPRWWWGYYHGRSASHPPRELVKQGEGTLDEDGTLEVEIDTSSALKQHGDLDHRYIIKAEVRDPSRRVIKGKGAIKVTRQAYYAHVNTGGGWYRPGEEMQITIRCNTPDGEPVQTEGQVTVSRVAYGGPQNGEIKQEKIKSWKASTNERGRLKFRLRHERSDRLRIKFEAPDKWGGTVRGYGLVWVCGEDFDGRLHRFNNLELITDKRTYEPGDTAHLMINTRHPDSYVLFSNEVDDGHLLNWQLLHLPDGHRVIDIPIKRQHRPNFFVEATTVADARVHQQMKRLCVPPKKGVVNLNVSTDKGTYKPGEKAQISLRATDTKGNPVNAQVCLTGYDKSVTYIQSEYTPEIKKFFHGRVRRHRLQMRTNLTEQFSSTGRVRRPYRYRGLRPPAWRGYWGMTGTNWNTFGDKELQRWSGRRHSSGMRAMGARSEEAAMDTVAAVSGGGGRAPREKMKAKKMANKPAAPAGGKQKMKKAKVRQEFADTAIWQPTITTGEDGKATATVEMPENLTTWRINSWAMTRGTRVGETTAEAITTKNLLVRLQAPRFFLEYDQVVLSANVHNYLDEAKTARVSIELPDKLLKLMDDHPAKREVEVPADGTRRVDWRVKVLKEGTADITVKALTDEESDAMRKSFPVMVHGMTKQVARTGSMRPHEKQNSHTLKFRVPEKRRPQLTRLEVQYSPTLVGAMLDALPYCLEYPYGCTEQTTSRFLPAVLTLDTLQNMGIELEDVKKARGRMEEIRRTEKGENIKIYADNPVFDSDKMHDIIGKGLRRLQSMQHDDGGWGWWKKGDSSGYMTAYVIYSLLEAQQADVKVDRDMIRQGLRFLKDWEQQKMAAEHWTPHSRHALACYVLAQKDMRAVDKDKNDERPDDCLDRLFEGRDKLNHYGRALLSLALAELGEKKRAKTVLRNIMQYRQEHEKTGKVWFRTPESGWWYWWNNDIETNAWILRAIVRLKPESKDAPGLVRWLLENRRNGYYWNSTRDTTLCIAAMSEFVAATGEGNFDYTLTLNLDDGESVKKVKINRDNFFTYDNRLVIEGKALTGGTHTLKITKEGPGALYYNSYLRYFTKEKDIRAAGHRLEVQRRYFRLKQIDHEVEVEGAEGQKIKEKRLRYKRIPLEHGDRVESGDIIQVELEVNSDNNYTYLCFEDKKPAGCEPIRLRSGGKRQEGFYSYMQLRDEMVTFFVRDLQQGEHLLRYRLRAEIPGRFHALPSVLYGMYAPKLRANSNEQVITITDK